MRMRAAFERVNPLASAIGLAVAGILLVTTIFLTIFDLPWVAFLSGVLCAAAIGMVTRLAYAETALAEVRDTVRYVDDDLSAMIAYLSADGTIRFHNQSFRYWLHARREAINGRSLRDVVGLTVHGRLRAGLDAALAGRMSHDVRVHEGFGAAPARLYTQYLPHFGAGGNVIGAFILQTDITSLPELPGFARAPSPQAASPAAPAPTAAAPAEPPGAPGAPAAADEPGGDAGGEERRVFVNTIAEELTGWTDAGERLRAALANDEFCLGSQAIMPASGEGAPFYEVYLRLREEEQSLLPPGAFLPLAEEHGMLGDLDRWVVGHVLDWTGARPGRRETMYCINVSATTLADRSFPAFVTAELERRSVPASLLCFEVLESDALAQQRDAARFVGAMADAGCRTTLCSFGRNAQSYSLLKHLRVDYLKIDGDIILGLARNPVDLIKLKAIARVARLTRRQTIAEFVEDDETLATVRAAGVDFVQGFGIARPMPMDDLPQESAGPAR